MTRRANAYVVAVALVGTALAVPSLVSASTGGAGLKSTNNGTSASSGAPGVVQPGNQTVSASGDGVSISTRQSSFLHGQMRFTGHVPHAGRNRIVEIERLGSETNWAWQPTAHATASGDGSYTVIWHPNHIGPFSFRAVVERSVSGQTIASSPSVHATVFRRAIATLYGPGFYGSTTACGETLHRNTLGTANRTLPCGTPVEVYWHGRTIVIPVIDRGPYANNADWDLTEATARKLSMPGTETIGAVSLPRGH